MNSALSNEEYEYLLKEQESQKLIKEIKNRREQKEIEEKLERDYDNYLQRKQVDSEDRDPEMSKLKECNCLVLKQAAENALINLSESQTLFKPVLKLISK